LDETDKALILEIENARLKVENAIEEFHFRDALFEVIDLARKGNKYLQEKEPWKKVASSQSPVTNEPATN
jgi:methionyl-tRNA synthetase